MDVSSVTTLLADASSAAATVGTAIFAVLGVALAFRMARRIFS